MFGKSGDGKSTFINFLINWLFHGSFENADKGPLYVAAPIQFRIKDKSNPQSRKSVLVEIPFGGISKNLTAEASKGNTSASTTKLPEHFVIQIPGSKYKIHIIDNPGVESSNGSIGDDKTAQDVDQKNLEATLNQILQLPYVSSFIILMKANENKLNAQFQKVIKSLLSQLDKSANENVLFAYTYASICNFEDAPSIDPLEQALQQLELDIELTDEKMFYFDNFPILYLAFKSQGFPQDDKKGKAKEYWEESSKNMIELFNHIDGLESYNAAILGAQEECKTLTVTISLLLIKVCCTNNENIVKYETIMKEEAEKGGMQLIELDETKLVFKPKDQPSTVCLHPDCHRKQQINPKNEPQKVKNLYLHTCCKGCWVPFAKQWKSMLYCCQAICKLTGKCKTCGHDFHQHHRIAYDLGKAEDRFKFSLQEAGERMKKFQSELDIIIGTLVFFTMFLRWHCMLKEDDDLAIKHISKELEISVQERNHVSQRVNELRKITADLKEKLFDDNIGEQEDLKQFQSQVHDLANEVKKYSNVEIQLKPSLEQIQANERYKAEYKEKETELLHVEAKHKEMEMLVQGMTGIKNKFCEKMNLFKSNDQVLARENVRKKIDEVCNLEISGEIFNLYYETNQQKKEVEKPLPMHKVNVRDTHKEPFRKLPVEA